MSAHFYHLFRIDPRVLTLTQDPRAFGSAVQQNLKFERIDPAVFTHAYLLLGEQPQRFTSDLTFYLATIRAFFERSPKAETLCIPPDANPDAKRRLSEDLGVGFAVYFMVMAFGVRWDTISQIPQNNNLSRKRPDFQGFTDQNGRYLFEAKGTTNLSSLENTVTNAINQVYGYPEQALSKIAIVSYLSADERFFPSTTFVIDPPALPDVVKPDVETSRLLHFEKVLEFSGMPEVAKKYMSTLAVKLRNDMRSEDSEQTSFARRNQFTTLRDGIRQDFAVAFDSLPRFQAFDSQCVGQILSPAPGIKIFCGTDVRCLNAGIGFERLPQIEARVDVTERSTTSRLADGTVLQVLLTRENEKLS